MPIFKNSKFPLNSPGCRIEKWGPDVEILVASAKVGTEKFLVSKLSTLASKRFLRDGKEMKSPTIKKYLNAYQYLQDIYQFRKIQDAKFSYDVWARDLGIYDKSYVRMMVLGKRPLNSKMTEAFACSLNLSADEKEYFINLVYYTQSKTQEQKNLFGAKLIQLLKSEIDQLEIQAQYDFLSNPLLPRLQVFLSFHDVNQNPANLAWLLNCQEVEIQQAMEKLSELGLIEKVEGLWRPKKKSFNVPDEFGNIGLEVFYTQNLNAAKEAIRLPKEKRRFKSLFLPLNKEEFVSFIEGLQEYISLQLIKYNPDNYEDRSLYQVHFNIIPVSSEMKLEKEQVL